MAMFSGLLFFFSLGHSHVHVKREEKIEGVHVSVLIFLNEKIK